jgi:hypothetical protein
MSRNRQQPSGTDDDPSPWSRTGSTAGPDVLGADAGRVSGGGRFRLAGAALAIFLVLAIGGSWADRLERGHEFDALTTTIDSSQQSVSFAVQQVVSTRNYTMPLLVTSSSATVREGLEKLIDQAAQRRVVDLEAQRRRVDGVFIVPWHTAERRARADYVAYLDARIAAMQSMADGNGQPTDEETVFSALQQQAEQALDAATSSQAGRAATLFSSPPP